MDELYNSIVKYLELVHSDIYTSTGHFTDEQVERISEFGFDIQCSDYYDGKILKVTDEYIATHSTKCMQTHNVYIKHIDKIYFHFCKKNDSGDFVYRMIKRDDLPDEAWFISTVLYYPAIGIVRKALPIGKENIELFYKLKEHISTTYPDLRIRLGVQ